MKIPMTVCAALSTALLFTGCCGPKKSSAAYRTSSSTAYAAPATTTTTETDTTRVREQETATTNLAEGEYSMPLYSEQLKVGKREVESGSVRLRKTVKTESASQPVELRRETITIDRQAFEDAQRNAAAGQPNTIGAAFQDKEIVIEIKREEPVVEVSPVVSGRIVAKKGATTERQNVDRQVRREVVEVIKQGDSKDIIITERVNQDTAVGAPGQDANRQTGEKSTTTTTTPAPATPPPTNNTTPNTTPQP
jgi:uncharacterized protein (TIGR02271 family)